ncbi:MAG: class I SAM-dependent methyltransferase [Anaerolineae bacterium]|jgi:SAM-dependent methyltransferase|nr:class I SAM-dependent methyltransferase [Anaerolineae bacterium]
MKPEIARQLIELNRQFYSDFGDAFAATRRRIQPGIRTVLQRLEKLAPHPGDWLDLGCGGGQVALAWASFKRKGSYLGVDFSLELLTEARTRAADIHASGLSVAYAQSDMSAEAIEAEFQPESFDGVLAFASFHHLPTVAMRLALLESVYRILKPGGLFIHSEWQFHNSPRLMERVQAWSRIGLSDTDVDDNDYLLDWRYALPGQAEQTGLRYVHLYTREELADLMKACSFSPVFEFDSDGKEGNLALYQCWRKRC